MPFTFKIRAALLLSIQALFGSATPQAQDKPPQPLALYSAQDWQAIHCDLSGSGHSLSATFWKGYQSTGFETVTLPLPDWRSSRSFQFEVDNRYNEPFSIFVRLSHRADHPAAETYTGGTFDGFVIGPGRATVEISLENVQSPAGTPIDAKHIVWVGIYAQPLFLRDGIDLKFTQDRTFQFSNFRLSAQPAKLQKQPYGDLLFEHTEPTLQSQRTEVERALDRLRSTIERARAQGIDTAYAEIYPSIAGIAFHSRLVAFWQNRAEEQRRVLTYLLASTKAADAMLRAALAGTAPRLTVPELPPYSDLSIRGGYFRRGDKPVLPFGMLYNHGGPLLRWFANSETDYGTQLVAGGTRQDVEHQPIWAAYQTYPDTHRVGWPHADHIIRDADSWEVLGPPVSVCLESPHSRDAIRAMIDKFEGTAGPRRQLVQNMGFEYTYVCYCDYTRRMWADWLQRKYSDIGAANRIWAAQYPDFSAVPMPRPQEARANRALWFDWSSFNLYRFLEQIRWTRDQIRRSRPDEPLTVGSPYYAFSPSFWTGVDEEELADSGIANVQLEENYALDTLMPEYLHALAGGRPVVDFEYHGVVHQILPSFLHGDAAISMWWWNDAKRWTPNEPINEWTTSFPQSFTIPLSDLAKAMRDSLDLRRLGPEIAALGSAPRPVAILYSKTSMLQQLPDESAETETTPYLTELRRTYNASQSSGLYVGVTTEKKILAGDLRDRKVLVLTAVQYLPKSVIAEISHWVDDGGTLIVSPDSLAADEYARAYSGVPWPGIRVVRREPPHLTRGEKFVTEYNFADAPRFPFSAANLSLQSAGMRQVLECDPARIFARFKDGSPAVVRIRQNRGAVYWLASPLVPESWAQFLGFAAANAGVPSDLAVTQQNGGSAPAVEYRVTRFGQGRLAYLFNNSDQDLTLALRPGFSYNAVLNRRTETPLSGARLSLPARETAILEFR